MFPFLPSIILYGDGDPYADSDQYGDTGPTTISYGSDYGTGTYSAYNSDNGRYTDTIEIAGYGTDSNQGYGYGSGGTDDRYSVSTSSGGTYGYSSENTMHSYRDVVFEYVVDMLDGDEEI